MLNPEIHKKEFQSPLPLRGATALGLKHETRSWDFNPRSPCGERPTASANWWGRTNFNPRSPCGERHTSGANTTQDKYFNPRSPCGERHKRAPRTAQHKGISIPAPLAGSDQHLPQPCARIVQFQSPLPLRGATPEDQCDNQPAQISIPAPLAGSDLFHGLTGTPRRISIPAPLAGSDYIHTFNSTTVGHFNPRSPCGERR